jgi:RNA polymerase sigma factor (sigma-70 family)
MRFPSTRRSAVLASQSSDAEERRQALESLVDAYWKPVYKFVRIKWHCNTDDAADYTQGFFARAIEKDFFRSYDPSKGTFRTFLRTCLEGFVANERKAASRWKRGGDATMLSLDFATAEGELREHPPSPDASPEELFHQEWVRGLFALALDDFRKLCEARGKHSEFEIFSRYDLDDTASYSALAQEFAIPVTTVTNRLAWSRREFRKLLIDRLRSVDGRESELL